MENVAFTFYLMGQDDERKHGKKFISNIANLAPLYRLGRHKERYANCPQKSKLITELVFEFEKHEFFPNLVDIFLDGKYSHRLLKKMMEELGYRIPASPDCAHFHAWRIK